MVTLPFGSCRAIRRFPARAIRVEGDPDGRGRAALVSEVRRTVRAMTYQNMIVKAELRPYPRGACGSPQNAWRAAFAAARLNTLGRRPQIPPAAGAAYALALRVVRAAAPEWADFVPARKN
jgi:hypothetical protein